MPPGNSTRQSIREKREKKPSIANGAINPTIHTVLSLFGTRTDDMVYASSSPMPAEASTRLRRTSSLIDPPPNRARPHIQSKSHTARISRLTTNLDHDVRILCLL